MAKKTDDGYVRGTSESGFAFAIEEAALDDMELMDLLGELADGKSYAVGKVSELLLGKEQKKQLYDYIRNPETGRVPASKFQDELMSIFDACKETKNS